MAVKNTEYSLTDLKAAFELSSRFAENANYFIRTVDNATESERRDAAFYNSLSSKLKNKIDEKLREIDDNL